MKQHLRQFFFGTSLNDNKVVNTGWLLFRLHVGLSIAIHAGLPKMNTLVAPGWFTEQVADLGFTFPSPAFWAGMAAWGEFVGGLLIAVGLFTRFAALQLAFQFFVIAFLWYEKPEPFTGMYFQHLFFWCYVLIVFAGGGRYSLDKLIMARRNIKIASAVKVAIASILLLVGLNGYSQNTNVSIEDFKPLAGKWTGKLSYLDYVSNTPETIKAGIEVEIKTGNMFAFSIYYTNEPNHNSTEKYTIGEKGSMINDRKVIERTVQADGAVKIVMEDRGIDGNDDKMATFHHILLISKDKFVITKMVRYDGEESFFQRNQYVFSRDFI
jgi:uncharacterized membrane protein YphA (DoxX/SURF4 family)